MAHVLCSYGLTFDFSVHTDAPGIIVRNSDRDTVNKEYPQYAKYLDMSLEDFRKNAPKLARELFGTRRGRLQQKKTLLEHLTERKLSKSLSVLLAPRQ